MIQENPPELATAMTPRTQVPRTMQIFAEVHPTLIPSSDLESEMRNRGFARSYAAHKLVADNKKMLAFAFRHENDREAATAWQPGRQISTRYASARNQRPLCP